MYCENCGGVLGDHSRFCVVCGSAKRGSMNDSGRNAPLASAPQMEPKTTYFQMPRWFRWQTLGIAAFVALVLFGVGWVMLKPWIESERINNAAYRAAALKRAEKREEERLAMERLGTFAQAAPADIFGNVPLLCGALVSEGLSTRSWKYAEVEYQCITSYVDIGAPGPIGLATNIAYYVTGTVASRANSIKIVVNMNNRSTRSAGRKRLVSATKLLFTNLGQQAPAGLMAAIQADKAFVSREPYGTVAYEIDRSNIETLAVSIKAQ